MLVFNDAESECCMKKSVIMLSVVAPQFAKYKEVKNTGEAS